MRVRPARLPRGGRERSRHTPIIFLTAAITGESHVAKGYSIGAVDYLINPLDPDAKPPEAPKTPKAEGADYDY